MGVLFSIVFSAGPANQKLSYISKHCTAGITMLEFDDSNLFFLIKVIKLNYSEKLQSSFKIFRFPWL